MKRSSLPKRQKEKWSKVMIADMMSSEESDEGDETIVVKPLQWRSSRVTEFFKNIDVLGTERKNSQALRQRKPRVISSVASQCPKPAATLPCWVFV